MKKDSLLSIGIILASFLLIIFVLQPLLETNSTLGVEIEELRIQQEKKSADYEAAKKSSDMFFTLTEAEKEKVRNLIPENMDQKSVIDDLSSIAQDLSASLTSATFSMPSQKEGIKRVSIVSNFSITANTKKVIDLLSAIEKSKRLFTINSLSILFGKDKSDLSVTMESYYKND